MFLYDEVERSKPSSQSFTAIPLLNVQAVLPHSEEHTGNSFISKALSGLTISPNTVK